MKTFCLFVFFAGVSILSQAQVRLGIQAGPHSASVKEKNSIPGWETAIGSGYSPKSGLNIGVVAEIPLTGSIHNRWFIHTGIQYMAKGRSYAMVNDSIGSLESDTISAAHDFSVNYIDVPFNVAYRLPLGKKASLLLSAGPYVGFFYNGKVSSETRLYSTNSFKSDEQQLEAGKEPGKANTFDAGLNGRAGIELGSMYISGFVSQGLTSFYNTGYPATLRHSVKGVSVGFWLNKRKQADITQVPLLTVAAPQPRSAVLPNNIPVADIFQVNHENDIAKYVAPYEPPIAEQEVQKINFAAKNILFVAGSDQLTESSAAHLDQVAAVLAAHQSYQLTIEGHTDASGNADQNRALSLKRAESVKEYITKKGIAANRLQAIGFGADQPVDNNSTAAGRANNRRVEMTLSR